jgi:hypothetical protein
VCRNFRLKKEWLPPTVLQWKCQIPFLLKRNRQRKNLFPNWAGHKAECFPAKTVTEYYFQKGLPLGTEKSCPGRAE